MERLTIRNSDGSVSQPMDLRWGDALKRLAAYEDTGLEPEEVAKCRDYREYVRRRFPNLQHIDVLSKADADGRLVVLPCKIGAPCFRIYNCHCGDFYREERCKKKEEAKLVDVVEYPYPYANMVYCKRIVESKFSLKDIANFGKTVFLTREEAEAAVEREVRTSK